jgi:adenine phosphoribosyltransferase
MSINRKENGLLTEKEMKALITEVADFPKPGILFRDISPLLKYKFREVVDNLTALLDEKEWDKVDYIAGIESRGFIFASALSYKLGKGLLLIRKAGKLPNPAGSTSYNLEYGKAVLEMKEGNGRVVIIDDVLATGGTMRASIELAQKVGYSVERTMVLADLGIAEQGTLSACLVRSLFSY